MEYLSSCEIKYNENIQELESSTSWNIFFANLREDKHFSLPIIREFYLVKNQFLKNGWTDVLLKFHFSVMYGLGKSFNIRKY